MNDGPGNYWNGLTRGFTIGLIIGFGLAYAVAVAQLTLSQLRDTRQQVMESIDDQNSLIKTHILIQETKRISDKKIEENENE